MVIKAKKSCEPAVKGDRGVVSAVPEVAAAIVDKCCSVEMSGPVCFCANLPNLRRLFVEARTEAEENEYSRTAFYNLVFYISSVAVFSLVAQRMSGGKIHK
ncbi:hypothetical protein BGW36DRAFT_429982 [Talaromyces proteolyticus]|uniref:Uncharacterized protein n=1 Tax=Talaromyces proteolyticus TaxID=1131652 RepID=A0AAD4KJN6_9EURO|nr:uncharacterized protein BGW36DRAFT_429982 [Talaromyces proteolyticus]KAH8693960.1 hypothetical protein BGW36DRAFT_429982 [Talaromyces proteolyticus]